MNTNLLLNLQLFADEATLHANKTSHPSLSPTMKTFYDTSLLENARDVLVFNQFGDKQKIHGNKVEWRKFNTFEKALIPITEGVTPTGSSFGMTKIEASTTQHGDYTTVTDRLEYEAYDDIIMGCTQEMGASSGATFDTLTRNVLVSGNCVAYCPNGDKEVTSRAELSSDCVLTPKIVNKANTWLKKNKAPKINGSYVMLIHPSVAEDFRESAEWKEYHKYNDVAPIFKGEMGEMHGFRFIESNEAKVHAPHSIAPGINRLTVRTAITSSTNTVSADVVGDGELNTTITSCNIPIYINGADNIIKAINGSGSILSLTLVNPVTNIPVGAMICGQGAGRDGSCTYDTLALGAKAYGVVDPENESMEMIVKDKKEIGGPLELYSTVGYKFCHGAKILYQERILRIESGSSYSMVDEGN